MQHEIVKHWTVQDKKAQHEIVIMKQYQISASLNSATLKGITLKSGTSLV